MAKNKIILIAIIAVFGAYLLTEKNRSEESLVSKVVFSSKKIGSRAPASIKRAKLKLKKIKNENKRVSILSYSIELRKIFKCYEQLNCPFSQSDSRAYDLAVGKKLKEKINEISEYVEEANIEDERIAALARKYLSVEDGHVKEAALLLLSTQPTSEDNLNSILDEVIDYHDSALLPVAFLEFEKYENESDRQMIEESLFKNMKSGSILVREGISKNLLTMINERNKEKVVMFMQSLPSDSNMRRNLQNSIERYEEQTKI